MQTYLPLQLVVDFCFATFHPCDELETKQKKQKQHKYEASTANDLQP